MSLGRDHGDGPAPPAANGEDRSAAELERDLDRIRNEMGNTINLIEDRLSPNRLIDKAFERMRGGPGAFAANLGRTVRKHPVPATMFAAGLAWLLFAERGDKAGSKSRQAPAPAPDHLSDARAAARPMRTGLPTASRSSGHFEGDRMMSGNWDQSRRSRWNPLHRRDSQSGGYLESGREGLAQVGSAARHQVQRARTGFEQMLDEQPLVLGAVAVALGAVLGATLPTTRIENRYLGPTRDDLQNRAGEYAREQWEKAKEVAVTAGAAALSEAEQQGVTPSSLYKSAKDKVTRVADAAGEAAREEAREQGLGSRSTSRS